MCTSRDLSETCPLGSRERKTGALPEGFLPRPLSASALSLLARSLPGSSAGTTVFIVSDKSTGDIFLARCANLFRHW